MNVLPCICFILVVSVQGLFAKDENWSRSHHSDSVRSVHALGELGVSASQHSIAIWKAQTGEGVMELSMPERDICGAWLTSNGNEVVVYVGQSCDTCFGTLLWLSTSDLRIIDSAGPIFTWSRGSGYVQAERPYAAISDACDRLRFSFYMQVISGGHRIEYFPDEYECDLSSRSITSQYLSILDLGGPMRFESHDRVVTHYPPFWDEQSIESSVSPSGSYSFDGYALRERATAVPLRHKLREPCYIVRYGPNDAHVIGLRSRRVGASIYRYDLCVVNIAKDSIEHVLDSLLSDDPVIWADPQCRRVYAGTRSGEIRAWSIPDRVTYTEPSCDLDMPLTVVADSLYFLSAVMIPDTVPSQVVVDPGDGRRVSSSTSMSWRDVGLATVRLLATSATGSEVLAQRVISVRAGTPPRAASRYLRTSGGIASIDVGDEGLVLICTRDGNGIVVDDELQVQLARRLMINGFGAVWTGPLSFTLLSSETSSQNYRGQISTEHRVRCRTYDMESRSEMIGNSAVSSGGYAWTEPSEDSMQQVFQNAHSRDVWFSAFWYSPGKPYYGGMSKGFRFHAFRDSSYIAKSYTIEDGAPAGYVQYRVVAACWLEGGKRIVAHLGSWSPGGTSYYYVDLNETDTVVQTMIGGPKTTGLTAIGQHYIVIDSQWISLDVFGLAQRHPYTSPFAEDAVPGHAIAWKDGWFYSFSPNGRVHDSVQADTMRPTVIRVLPDGRIIAGYTSGLVAIYGDGRRDLTSVDANTEQAALSCWPSPTTSELSYALPPSMSTPATLEIYDLQGRLCGTTTLSEHHGKVDITSIMNMEATGVFIVRAHTSSVVAYAKIVVVK